MLTLCTTPEYCLDYDRAASFAFFMFSVVVLLVCEVNDANNISMRAD
jgi:hypothetical protein